MLTGTAFAAFVAMTAPQSAMAEECVMEDSGSATQSLSLIHI